MEYVDLTQENSAPDRSIMFVKCEGKYLTVENCRFPEYEWTNSLPLATIYPCNQVMKDMLLDWAHKNRLLITFVEFKDAE